MTCGCEQKKEVPETKTPQHWAAAFRVPIFEFWFFLEVIARGAFQEGA